MFCLVAGGTFFNLAVLRQKIRRDRMSLDKIAKEQMALEDS